MRLRHPVYPGGYHPHRVPELVGDKRDRRRQKTEDRRQKKEYEYIRIYVYILSLVQQATDVASFSGNGELISEGGDVVTRGMAGCSRDVAMSLPGEWLVPLLNNMNSSE